MGTAFEDLCGAFLTHDPVQAGQYREVRRYADWARERGLPATDAGIDRVAELRDDPGYFAAIQCKFPETGGSIPKKEIDSFLAASGRSEFRRRVWIDTTGRPWSRDADETLRVQEKPVQRIGLHYFKASPIDWAAYVASGAVGEREPPRTPWRHQQDAIDSALAHLAPQGTRGKLLTPYFLSADWSKRPDKRSVYLADCRERRVRRCEPPSPARLWASRRLRGCQRRRLARA
ncbi:MAG: hypothetical protein OXC28_19730 [Defluviicoccus sp.]|nr:hypothetical protein [Defluviicoccus sp.]